MRMYEIEYTKEELQVPGVDKHHIVFKSQGGTEHAFNIVTLPHGFHIGSRGPHKNRETDLKLKKMEQNTLFDVFKNDTYVLNEVLRILDPYNKMSSRKIEKSLKGKQCGYVDGVPIYDRESLVRTLMGGKLY